jgi:hypothetical protein
MDGRYNPSMQGHDIAAFFCALVRTLKAGARSAVLLRTDARAYAATPAQLVILIAAKLRRIEVRLEGAARP